MLDRGELVDTRGEQQEATIAMPAPASRYAHDSAMTAKSAVMTTTRSRLITASSVASTGTVFTFRPIMFTEFGI
ncbi:hypothetical protein GCM10007160_35750 [Litchfieldella qijiaojingensis]|uniref:Uncharacterized protein n=1 Tax=Litchfieldella qijiaojingensis TaxID=980347 RepID=A0ABQ2Z8R0_9GAMM|nr:hypothetical protein [Halomonas qijiaojingensis]GGY04922.1 hypothetical protein GCM10007160_35750 [Halomonas qijiaojingensis]